MYFNLLLGKPLIRYMFLGNRVDLVKENVKLTISVQITIVKGREIKVRYFIKNPFLTEMRIVMFVIVQGGIINFKVLGQLY